MNYLFIWFALRGSSFSLFLLKRCPQETNFMNYSTHPSFIPQSQNLSEYAIKQILKVIITYYNYMYHTRTHVNRLSSFAQLLSCTNTCRVPHTLRFWIRHSTPLNFTGVVQLSFSTPAVPKKGWWRIKVVVGRQVDEQPFLVTKFFPKAFEVRGNFYGLLRKCDVLLILSMMMCVS